MLEQNINRPNVLEDVYNLYHQNTEQVTLITE